MFRRTMLLAAAVAAVAIAPGCVSSRRPADRVALRTQTPMHTAARRAPVTRTMTARPVSRTYDPYAAAPAAEGYHVVRRYQQHEDGSISAIGAPTYAAPTYTTHVPAVSVPTVIRGPAVPSNSYDAAIALPGAPAIPVASTRPVTTLPIPSAAKRAPAPIDLGPSCVGGQCDIPTECTGEGCGVPAPLDFLGGIGDD